MKLVTALGGALYLALHATTAYAVDNSPARKTYIQNQLMQANAGLSAEVREEKYLALEGSAFAFFRGTDHLYYSDIQSNVIAIPSSWPATSQIKTWISGDLHPQNVGFLTTKDDVVVLDLNDPDESYVAPFYFDLIRMVAGVHLMRDDVSFNFSQSEAQTLSFDNFLSEYQSTLTAVNGNSTETTIVLSSGNLSGFVKDEAQALASTTNLSLLQKWTVLSNGVRRFDFSNANLATMTSADNAEVDAGYAAYVSSLGSFASGQPSYYFNIKDRAVRLHSGLGSLGLKKYYLLIEGPSTGQSDDILLELKWQVRPTMLSSALSGSASTYASQFSTHGQRAVTAWKGLLNKVDDHAGYLVSSTGSYLVRRISRAKFSLDAADFTAKADLANFLTYAARAVAYAHARSDKDYSTTYVNYNFENGALNAIATWPQAKTTMQSLGENYATQVAADYQLFLELRAAGSL